MKRSVLAVIQESAKPVPASKLLKQVIKLLSSMPLVRYYLISEVHPSCQTGITAESVRDQLESALDDDDVKAIVLHVNSGGGAATTSDLIWHDVKRASEQKPVIASMGTVAASGGYYIAAGADTIVAGENTITGSIGIFNLLFNSQELFNENLGIGFETFETHEYADLFDLTRPFTSSEERVIQQNVERGYESFVNRMADSRGMTYEEINEVARGRVWTGVDAHERGLVDVLGGIDRAIEIAAEKQESKHIHSITIPSRRISFNSCLPQEILSFSHL